MKFIHHIKKQLAFGLLLAMVIGAFAGCSSTQEASNESPRPWNSPEGWQNGALPGSLTQPR